MPQEKSVGAIIFRMDPPSHEVSAGQRNGERLYLLLKYKAKHWDFVKGHIDPGETDEQTLRREAKEEANLDDLEIISGFKEYAKLVFKQYKEKMTKEDLEKGKPVWVFKIVTFYLAKTNTKDIKLSWEHKDFKWLPINEAIKQTTFKGSKEILRKANEFLEKNK